jgi:hypothetical protein
VSDLEILPSLFSCVMSGLSRPSESYPRSLIRHHGRSGRDRAPEGVRNFVCGA